MLDNVGVYGGAAVLSGTTVLSGTNIFERNTATVDGGALSLSDTVISGTNTFTNNTAQRHGGALWVGQGPPVSVSGTVCGGGNSAGTAGGFLFVQSNRLLQIAEGAEVTVAFNTPDTVYNEGNLTCGSSPSWAGLNTTTGTTYNITGPFCACSDTFASVEAGGSYACDCVAPWNQATCGFSPHPCPVSRRQNVQWAAAAATYMHVAVKSTGSLSPALSMP